LRATSSNVAAAEHVLHYLGRYTHRVAISNHSDATAQVFYSTCGNARGAAWSAISKKSKQGSAFAEFTEIPVNEMVRRLILH
jgi:hypothetical protein